MKFFSILMVTLSAISCSTNKDGIDQTTASDEQTSQIDSTQQREAIEHSINEKLSPEYKKRIEEQKKK